MPKLVPGYRDEVKEKILKTAWEVIIHKGTKESTMDDFAAAMNCSKGALYNYFRNKDELLEEVIMTHHVKIKEQLFARFSEGDFLINAEKYFDIEIMNALDIIQTTYDLLSEGSRNEKLSAALKMKYNGALDSFLQLLKYIQDKGMAKFKMELHEAAGYIYALRSGLLSGMVTGLPKETARKIWMDGLKGIIST